MLTKSTKSEKVIRDIFDESPDVLSLIINQDGVITYTNKNYAERLKLESNKDARKNYFTDFPDSINYIEVEKVKSVIQTKKAVTFETVIRDKNYKYFITPHLTKQNKIENISIIGFLHSSVDDTILELKSNINSLNKQNSDLLELIEKLSLQNIELTKTNNLLNENLDSKDKFFSILSHDLRGQMGNMINSSDLIVESFDDLEPDELKNIVSILNKTIRKNYDLLDNLLLWASFERGKIQLKIELVRLKDIIEYSLGNLNYEIAKKNIIIENKIDNNIYANLDMKYMEIVFNNILMNSIKFSYPGGKVEISHNTENNDFIEINISDSGIGMDEATYNDLFKIDKIHSNYGTEKETGSGMGLLVAKRIIDEIKGELKIITKPNNGTTVQIYCKKN